MSDPCVPLTLSRALEDFPIANLPLREHQLAAAGSEACSVHPHAWLDPADVQALRQGACSTLVDPSDQQPIAWLGSAPDPSSALAATRSFIIRHPWDLLRANELAVAALNGQCLHGDVHPLAVLEGAVHLGKGSRILPGVFIEGNVIIGENCKIGPNCYLRGNTSIGNSCHIGQSVEIKNCLILSHTNVGHLSYIGDSILGERVNLGAGTTVSNLRHDGKNHRSMVRGELIDTGRRKFGTIIGDGVHTGIQTSIYPGRKLWPGTSTRPGGIVQYDLLP
jgi:UDP-N-acetylglucosamine diphosphorylase / glucose-1-phosphate thymidylyltransferase / UDP-N-acetylgalactosamine diphosphorylase / glucosamine-1-phosphate N-acetyltransferase / galactosamine-1-phosphate N-acetyltransferase